MKWALERVVWIDSAKSRDWSSLGDARICHGDSDITTVGYVIDEDPKYILVASTIGDEQVCLQMQIPKVAIVERTVLEGAWPIDSTALTADRATAAG